MLTPVEKNKIIDAIINGNVKRHAVFGRDTYIVTNKDNKKIAEVENAWDYGLYYIEFAGRTYSTEWRENANKAITADQQAIFDVIKACSEKVSAQIELEIAQKKYMERMQALAKQRS